MLPPLDEDVWELYDGTTDWTQAHDLAAEMPERLAALQRLWLIEAVKYNVLPIDDRRFERLNPTIAGRPQLITGTTQVLFPGMKRLSENSVLDVKNRSFAVTAAIETPGAGRHQRGDHRAGRPVRRLGALRQGRPGQVRLQPPRDAGVRHRGEGGASPRALTRSASSSPTTVVASPRAATSRSTTTVATSGSGRVDQTQPMIFSADETTDIGDDYGMPVSADYGGASRFNGRIDVVQIDLGDDDHSHLIDPAEVARVAMSRQ